eukprot:SAG31_NODE_62_length_28678_cov_21.548270_6_plen_184_part_00
MQRTIGLFLIVSSCKQVESAALQSASISLGSLLLGRGPPNLAQLHAGANSINRHGGPQAVTTTAPLFGDRYWNFHGMLSDVQLSSSTAWPIKEQCIELNGEQEPLASWSHAVGGRLVDSSVSQHLRSGFSQWPTLALVFSVTKPPVSLYCAIDTRARRAPDGRRFLDDASGYGRSVRFSGVPV